MRARLVLAGGAALLAACVDPKPSSPTAADLRAIDLTPDHTITVDEQGFHPTTLEIASGDVVQLVNDGTEVHSFTADVRFDTGRMAPGDDTTMVLTAPGTIPYEDLEAPEHTATLTVVEARSSGG